MTGKEKTRENGDGRKHQKEERNEMEGRMQGTATTITGIYKSPCEHSASTEQIKVFNYLWLTSDSRSVFKTFFRFWVILKTILAMLFFLHLLPIASCLSLLLFYY